MLQTVITEHDIHRVRGQQAAHCRGAIRIDDAGHAGTLENQQRLVAAIGSPAVRGDGVREAAAATGTVAAADHTGLQAARLQRLDQRDNHRSFAGTAKGNVADDHHGDWCPVDLAHPQAIKQPSQRRYTAVDCLQRPQQPGPPRAFIPASQQGRFQASANH